MKELFNQLIQLQELYFASEEHSLAGQKKQLEQLEESIEALLKKLPDDTAAFFKTLQKNDPPAIAPVVNNTCYGCGMEIPTSLAAELLHMDKLYQCPTCSRFLYPYRGGKINLHDPSIRHKLPRLGIERFSAENLMIPELEADDKEGAITELAELISKELFFEDSELLIDRALKREAITSTAIEHSLAFPHVRGVDAGSLTMAVGLKKKGIKFGAPRNQLTRIIFFLIIPVAASAFYLTLLAGLIEALHEKDSRDRLLDCETREEAWDTLKELTGEHIS